MEQPSYSEYNIILWRENGLINHYPSCFLNFEFLKEDFEYIMFLKFDSLPEIPKLDIPKLVGALDLIFFDTKNAFVVLTPKKDAPFNKESPDELIYSFSCNFHLFKKMIKEFGEKDFYSTSFLFELLDNIFKGESDFHKILVRQLPIQHNQIQITNQCAVIIPHRGDNAYLKDLLFFLKQINKLSVFVGIDQVITDEIKEIRKAYPDVTFYGFSPNPLGPYIIRNQLIEESTDQLICFQDSDDIPCADRFERLSDYMIKNDCELCGSHEIRMDYYTKTVQAIRYPKNVMSALAKSAGHSLLHPTSIITRNSFYLAGKLSEERIFGNDTKFLYHCYFIFNKIQNIDEFLYFRRRRPGSLTTSPETRIGSPVRTNLFLRWIREFDRVKNDMLKLEDTSLNHEASKIKFEIKRLL